MLIEKATFFVALKAISRIIDLKSSMPILHHVHLISDGKQLQLVGTNLTATLQMAIPCDGAIDICVPLKPLLDFCKSQSRADTSGVEVQATQGKVIVTSDGAKTTIETMDPKDFPKRPGDALAPTAWKSVATWDAVKLGAALQWALLAVGTDEARLHLTGILIGNGEVVGLDGHRLHLIKFPGAPSKQLLLPGGTAQALAHLLPKKGDAVTRRAKDLVRITGRNWELETKLLDVVFPPYKQVIPSEEDFHTVLERKLLENAIKHLPRFGTKQHGIKLKVNGQIFIEQSSESGTASATVPLVDSTHTGKDLEIGVDARYVIDAIAGGEDIITARWLGSLDPILVEPGEGRVAVIMPMRI